jgi:uncharacterized phiE125 gp8 family phage protein
MMLIEQTGIPQAALPLAAMRDHLRLGTGFADDAFQDGLVEAHLRAAIATVEGRTAKVLVSRPFLWVLEDWRDGAAQGLPVAPVAAVTAVTLVDAAGTAVVVDPARYRLVRDTHRPKLASTGLLLPVPGAGGRIEVAFTAGFGDWDAVPADLAQAVFLLAAEYYERRFAGEGAMLPVAVAALIGRWRTVRTLAGGGR